MLCMAWKIIVERIYYFYTKMRIEMIVSQKLMRRIFDLMILYNMHNSSIVVAGHEWDGAGRKTFLFKHFMERDSNTPAMLQLHAQLLFLERFFTVAYYFLDKTNRPLFSYTLFRVNIATHKSNSTWNWNKNSISKRITLVIFYLGLRWNQLTVHCFHIII